MKSINLSIVIVTGLFFVAGCEPSKKVQETEATADQVATEEWIYLFEGTSADGWRGFNAEELPSNWVVEDGTLKSLGTGGDIGGDIVYGADEFEFFDLTFEWKIGEGGNSGVFYHVVEGDQYKAPYETGPEYQVLDDMGFPEPLEDWQLAGTDYAMYAADTIQKVVKPAGEWNTSRILFSEEKAEHWLNGKKLLEFVPYSEDWNERRNSGKWDAYPDYGMAKKGLIGLQDHGSLVWYKNIKIKKL